jgi:hypothetical protein
MSVRIDATSVSTVPDERRKKKRARCNNTRGCGAATVAHRDEPTMDTSHVRSVGARVSLVASKPGSEPSRSRSRGASPQSWALPKLTNRLQCQNQRFSLRWKLSSRTTTCLALR